jgi:cysteine desulfurase
VGWKGLYDGGMSSDADRLSPIYMDCAATTPVDARVRERVVEFLDGEFGNAGSRTHGFGVRARKAVEQARQQVAAVVAAGRGEVVFTSGATESNNLAILGLAEHGRETGRRHLVSTLIEHHAVLEPLQVLAKQGFDLTLIAPDEKGRVSAGEVRQAVRPDTLLVSVMQVNNETGVLQPIEAIAESMVDHPAFFHVDAAQGFGKEIDSLRHRRIDLISVSGHKLFAPKGVGALIARRREGHRPPLVPLMFGGGQELGLRPGTVPVHLVVGLGLAAELARNEAAERSRACRAFRARMMRGLGPLGPILNGDEQHTVPHIVNLSFPGLTGERVIEALRDEVAISDGSACTSQSLTCSHVLGAMGLDAARAEGATRWSWSHLTADPDWERVVEILRQVSVVDVKL